MKRSKRPRQLAKNASKLHKLIGELLTSSPLFKGYEIRQEYAVSWVNKDWTSGREKFDYVILGLKVVIEGHGIQHYLPVPFGGISIEEARRKLRQQQERDEAKRQAALDAGWAYVIVKHSEMKITQEELTERISEALKEVVVKKSVRAIEYLGGKQKPKYRNTKKILQKKQKYNWPKRKIQNRPFPKRRKNDD